MSDSFDRVRQLLRRLPGLGQRSAERIALHLLVEQPESCAALVDALRDAALHVGRCEVCGNVCETGPDKTGGICRICADASRDHALVCVVEQVPDLLAMEKAAAFRGVYHVLHGKLSPLRGIGPEALNMAALRARILSGSVLELILALSNDIEGEASCHYIQDQIAAGVELKVSRIGFGIPSGGGIGYADPVTLRSALDGRRSI